MKAIVVTDQAAGTAGMKLVERPEPQGSWSHRSTRIVSGSSAATVLNRLSLRVNVLR